ncbi:pyridoxamine 5'-phosphate oxidase [Dyadobacter frigoris]|uniref:Pyridoxine/pyridoxamine 5'-phosphate oxidase n=1 Tax=Dyadobacter frigoris TaxID=2576211 RepID=A0A4U6CVU2_9BACT|nr:pyridoxamine 5'-phosphate oxidase [Dyadobacter frigoris]TKT88900.1 pyridoxamine 5'-phosphate oxidase [Dyadobacter frigoris]GLU56094.1 pyridoxine/pyridoxamine 5'-phosphate oxidase [Dyadobacter frigoris]
MNQKIANIRADYSQNGLHESELNANPLKQFNKWFDEVLKSELSESNAMLLSTVNNGRPTGRIVLLKGVDEDGFTFYTNYESKKGQEIEANPQVALTFFWKELERQVRIEGKIEKTSEKDSDDYFAIRPRGSQIGAWVSHQSEVIENREFLEEKQKSFEQEFEGVTVPRPPHWGGYRVIPDYVEFWQGRPSRLHDRLAYVLKDGVWVTERLSP